MPGKEELPQLSPSLREADLLASVGRHLEDFAEQLTVSERTALSAVLKIGDRNPALVALASKPPEAVLKPEEVATYEELAAKPAPAGQGLRPGVVLVMKATRYCNLRCTYCRFWADGPNQIMSFEVLARAIHGVLAAPGVRAVDFCWHGGEATLLPIDFYLKALWLQERFRKPGQQVTNSVQTNGTRLKPEWLDFLKRYRFSVGVSLDGPPEIHDSRRLDTAGRPTSERVREGIAKLREHCSNLDQGVLMVVDDDVLALGAERLLEYLLEIDVRNVALLNVIPENDPGAQPYFEYFKYVDFFRDLFRLWWPDYADRIKFRELADLVEKVQRKRGKLCIFDGNCMGGYLTIEPMGEIGACDKYLGDSDYRFGNVLEMDLADLPAAPSFIAANTFTVRGIKGTNRCPWFEVCQGGCPHDRYLRGQKQVPYDESCCGLAPLLSDIAEALAKNPRSVVHSTQELFFKSKE